MLILFNTEILLIAMYNQPNAQLLHFNCTKYLLHVSSSEVLSSGS